MTTDIELAQSLKRRATYANEFGESLYVKADDILTLVEALEKAQQRNGELETYSKTAIEFREAARDENRHLKLELEIAEKRIAELESRTVKLPNSNDERFWGYGSEFEVELYDSCVFYALTASGIKVEDE